MKRHLLIGGPLNPPLEVLKTGGVMYLHYVVCSEFLYTIIYNVPIKF